MRRLAATSVLVFLLVGTEASVHAAVPGTLRFTSAQPFSGPVDVFLVPVSRPNDEVRNVRGWEPPKRATPPPPPRTLELTLASGIYAVAVDLGRDRAPAVFGKVEIQPAMTSVLTLVDGPKRDLDVLVRARETTKPLADAVIGVLESPSDEDRVLLALLRRRAPKTGTDGLLGIGALSNEAFLIPLEAKGRRSAVLRLPSESEGGRREIEIAPFQSLDVTVSGLALRKGEARPVLALGSCGKAKGGPCDTGHFKDEDFRRAPLGEDDHVVFQSLTPGSYRLFLEWNGARGASLPVESSARAEDPDSVAVELALTERVFRGRVRFADGRDADATVWAEGSSDGTRRPFPDRLGETRTGSGGSFELRVAVLPGQGAVLNARTEDPKGEGRLVPPPGAEDGLEIVVKTAGLTVTLNDKRTGRPIPDCPVAVEWTAKDRSIGSRRLNLRSDAEGAIRMGGLDVGRVNVLPFCKGYAVSQGFEFDLGSEDSREEEIALDPSGTP